MFKQKRLRNQLGFAHHALLVAMVVVIGVASFGTYKLVNSHADTVNSASTVGTNSATGCFNAGRVWNAGSQSCSAKCQAGAGDNKGGYCQRAIATDVSVAACNNLHRLYVVGAGCARRVDQQTTANAPQCQAAYPTYVDAAPDYCKAVTAAPAPVPALAPTAVKPTPAAATAAKPAPAAPAASRPAAAAYSAIDPTTCARFGRAYVAGAGCTNSCAAAAGGYALATDKKTNYCSKAFISASSVSAAKCAALHRVWAAVIPGCARDYANQASNSNNVQCLPGYPKYVAGADGENRAYCEKVGAAPQVAGSAASANKGSVKDAARDSKKGSNAAKQHTKAEQQNKASNNTPSQPKDSAVVASKPRKKGVSDSFCIVTLNGRTPDGKGGCKRVCPSGMGFYGTEIKGYDKCTSTNEALTGNWASNKVTETKCGILRSCTVHVTNGKKVKTMSAKQTCARLEACVKQQKKDSAAKRLRDNLNNFNLF